MQYPVAFFARCPFTVFILCSKQAKFVNFVLSIIPHTPIFFNMKRLAGHGSRMNRKQDFLKIIVIIAATPATSGDRELIVHAL